MTENERRRRKEKDKDAESGKGASHGFFRFGTLVRRLRAFGEEMSTPPSEQLLRSAWSIDSRGAEEAPLLYGLSVSALGRFVLQFLETLEHSFAEIEQWRGEDEAFASPLVLLRKAMRWTEPVQRLSDACKLLCHFEDQQSRRQSCECRLSPSKKDSFFSEKKCGVWSFPRGVTLLERLFFLADKARPRDILIAASEQKSDSESERFSVDVVLRLAFAETCVPFLQTLGAFTSRVRSLLSRRLFVVGIIA